MSHEDIAAIRKTIGEIDACMHTLRAHLSRLDAKENPSLTNKDLENQTRMAVSSYFTGLQKPGQEWFLEKYMGASHPFSWEQEHKILTDIILKDDVHTLSTRHETYKYQHYIIGDITDVLANPIRGRGRVLYDCPRIAYYMLHFTAMGRPEETDAYLRKVLAVQSSK